MPVRVPGGPPPGKRQNRSPRETLDFVPPAEVSHESPREACGVFGVCAPGIQVAHLTFDGLYALQHRGQESAGMAVSDGTEMMVVKDMGLVTNVFNERNLAGLRGPPGHRPHPLLDHRGVHLAQRPAGLPHLVARGGP